jgi:hypothetical protein
MKVFAAFSLPKAGLVRVWMQSWEARGWQPRLVSEREVREYVTVRRAIKARGGGHLTDLRVINFSCTPRGRAHRKLSKFGRPGWELADLVGFPEDSTEQSIRDCGRPV